MTAIRENIVGGLILGLVMAVVMSGPVIGFVYLLHVATDTPILEAAGLLALATAAIGALMLVFHLAASDS